MSSHIHKQPFSPSEQVGVSGRGGRWGRELSGWRHDLLGGTQCPSAVIMRAWNRLAYLPRLLDQQLLK